MKRDRVIELYSKAQDEAKGGKLVEYFARLVELETLERAAEKLATQHTWITSIAASQLVLALKETCDL